SAHYDTASLVVIHEMLPLLFLLAGAPDTTAVRAGLPTAAPGEVGMSATRLAAVDRVVMRGVERKGFPGAAVVVGRRGHIVLASGYGTLDWRADSRCVDAASSLYDLASITKVVATTTAIMVLYDRGQLALDDPVVRFLPAFGGGGKSAITIRQLLTHRSGLPSGRDLWRGGRTPTAARRLVLSTPLERAPGSRELYSDLGADVLAMVAERVAHEPLDRFLERVVFKPLGMRNTGFRPARAAREGAAPTEMHSARGHPLRGEVHDENASALGGVAGHAGLFSTATDLAIFAQMLLGGGAYDGVRIASDSTVALFTRRTAGWRALGWETCYGGGSCGQKMSERAFGHTGYTGTSMWIDQDRKSFVIVLTNWVHARPDGHVPDFLTLNDVRADVADIAALAVIDDSGGPPEMPASFRADRATSWESAGMRTLPRRCVTSQHAVAER
ncbi:MAG: serine hydrolase, partial [Gemmatimonadaceae bacterium]